MSEPRVLKGDFVIKSADNIDRVSFINGVLTIDPALALAIGAVSEGEINVLDGVIADVSFEVAAGDADECVITGTILDSSSVAIEAVRELDIYISEDAGGVGVSADSYSTGAAITGGTLIAAVTANKVWRILTDTDGTFAVTITDTSAPADQVLVAVNPVSRALHVSDVSGTSWGAGA